MEGSWPDQRINDCRVQISKLARVTYFFDTGRHTLFTMVRLPWQPGQSSFNQRRANSELLEESLIHAVACFFFSFLSIDINNYY